MRPIRTIASMEADAATWPTGQYENEKPKHTIEGGQATFELGEWEHCNDPWDRQYPPLGKVDQ